MKLRQRILSASILVGALVVAVALGWPWLAGLAVVAAGVGLLEFRRLGAALGAAPPWWLLAPLTAFWLLRAAYPQVAATDIGLGVALVAGLPLILGTASARRPLLGFALGLVGAAWLGYGLGFLLLLDRATGDPAANAALVYIALGVAVVSDTVAYLVGSAVGRHHFFASVSPRKTVEGAVAGALAAVILVGVALPLVLPRVGPLLAVGVGVVAVAASQAGDLVESQLKRSAGVKDAGGWIPGHGGILDRLDSLALVGPAVYSVLKLLHAF
ncbi:MAG TPA: phosphatidate cytidylyltransferase [Candidatus Dormibacteraeota bacterium]|nr:phosphatidate cytidylyltransferase [Candidatus Dormibacteraeota bacterium]